MELAENQTKVFGMSPDEKLSKPANRTREEAARERYMDRVKRVDPARWNVLNEKDELKATAPPVGAFVGPELSNSGEAPVLVIEIPFESELESQVIPLNWKLTKKKRIGTERLGKRWRQIKGRIWIPCKDYSANRDPYLTG